MKPQDLGCWKQVADVIGEERASIELQKVIDSGCTSLSASGNNIFEAFIWTETPQGLDFWWQIDEGNGNIPDIDSIDSRDSYNTEYEDFRFVVQQLVDYCNNSGVMCDELDAVEQMLKGM